MESVRRFRIDCGDALDREWLLAEAFEAGAAGAEESEFDGRFLADIYADPGRVEAVRAALVALGAPDVVVAALETLPEVDWSEAWKEGLEALEISPRLLVRPPFVDVPHAEGQRQIVIDPGQAFGTGNHASTRLCLEWIDGLLSGEIDGPPVDRVLDVGTGSGVLALSSVALGAESAVGFDVDPVATRAAEEAAHRNDLADRVAFFTGPIESVREETFPLVVANLLKRELLPIAAEVAARLDPGGRLVLAGLLEEDLRAVLACFSALGLSEAGCLRRSDAIGVWVSPCLAK